MFGGAPSEALTDETPLVPLQEADELADAVAVEAEGELEPKTGWWRGRSQAGEEEAVDPAGDLAAEFASEELVADEVDLLADAEAVAEESAEPRARRWWRSRAADDELTVVEPDSDMAGEIGSEAPVEGFHEDAFVTGAEGATEERPEPRVFVIFRYL